MNTDDYTQTVGQVMYAERRCPYPLAAEDRRELFARWVEANAEAVAEMEGWALEIAASGEPVAAQRLIERERWEGAARIVPVAYTDADGKTRRFRLNHNDRALLGRYLKARHPEMRVTMRRSMFDGEAV